MSNYQLNFISDKDLFKHVKETVEGYSFKIDLNQFNKNLIDPVKLTFDSYIYRQTIEKTIENEVLRQLDKSNTNLIGYFHQNIFKYIGKDWSVPENGYDVECTSKNIFVEMKNKHNTMNSSSAAKTYMRFQNTIIKNKDAKCFLVEVIAKKSQDIPWEITLDKKKQPVNNNIRRISIDKFYAHVTDNRYAFKELCQILPRVIYDVVETIKHRDKENSVFSQLNLITPDILTSLFILSFGKYEGFENLNLKID